MKNLKYVLLCSLLAFSSPILALEYQMGTDLNIDSVVNDDFYVISDKITINNDRPNDLAVLAGEATVNSNLGEDLFILAGKIDVKGQVQGDTRIAGGEINITQDIADDCLLAGGKINIKTNKIGGDVLIFGGEVVINTNIEGSVEIYASKVTLNGNVAGTTKIQANEIIINGNFTDKTKLEANKINFGAKTLFLSDLEYSQLGGSNDFIKDKVQGQIYFNEQTPSHQEKFNNVDSIVLAFLKGAFLILLLMLITKKFFIISAQKIHDNMLNSFLIGLGFFTLMPFLMLFLLVTVVGVPISFLMLFAYILVFYLSSVLMSLTFAYLTKMYYPQLKWNNYYIYALSLGIYILVVILPQFVNLSFISPLLFMAKVVAVCATIGALIKRKTEIWQEIC